MSPLEQFVVSLDEWPGGAILRIVLGLATPPLIHTLSVGHDSIWLSVALFFWFLAMIRVVTALLRRAIPFSLQAKTIWAERRNLARQHDSYQWRKLFWIGLGLLLNAAVSNSLTYGLLVVTFFCLIGGSAGLFAWTRQLQRIS